MEVPKYTGYVEHDPTARKAIYRADRSMEQSLAGITALDNPTEAFSHLPVFSRISITVYRAKSPGHQGENAGKRRREAAEDPLRRELTSLDNKLEEINRQRKSKEIGRSEYEEKKEELSQRVKEIRVLRGL